MFNKIKNFPIQISDAIKDTKDLKIDLDKIHRVVIMGMGGSAIGGDITRLILQNELKIPMYICRNYKLPNWVNNNSLVICSSYSGNTEETLSALNKCLEKNAEVAIVCSGGKLKDLALEKDLNHIIIPGGHPPRAMFGYGFTQLFFVLNNYGIINESFKVDFKKAISLIHFYIFQYFLRLSQFL